MCTQSNAGHYTDRMQPERCQRNGRWSQWVDVLARMFQEDDLSVEMNPTERPADSYPTTKIKQLKIIQHRYELEGESQGIPQGAPHFSSSSSGYFMGYCWFQLSLNTEAVYSSISLASISGPDRFVADSPCSGFNYHHLCGFELWMLTELDWCSKRVEINSIKGPSEGCNSYCVT